MATTATPTTTQPTNFGASTTLAPWSSNYMTSMLGQASALGQQPYQWYQGSMTAGQSPLQNAAFQGLGSLQTPDAYGQAQQGLNQAVSGFGNLNFNPTQFTTGQWNQQAAQQYMNPYLQSSLNPQLDEARRQADISRMGDASRLAKAGAYGGSRQAIMESEGQRNLLRNMSDITGKGYFDAYNTGMTGFMQDQDRALKAQGLSEDSRQFGAGYGLDTLKAQADAAKGLGALGNDISATQRANLGAQMAGGEIQRGIEQEGLDAEYALWAQAQQHPYSQLEFQKNMLAGIPTVIDQGNKLDDIQRITQLLMGANQINDSGLVDWLRTQLPG
jgi:hypothetical protein